jgi:hypothetical protein
MTKLLITEKLITNKQDFIKFSNIQDTVEFVKYSDFLQIQQRHYLKRTILNLYMTNLLISEIYQIVTINSHLTVFFKLKRTV